MGCSPIHPASHPRSEPAGDGPNKMSGGVFCSHSSEHYSGTAEGAYLRSGRVMRMMRRRERPHIICFSFAPDDSI